MKVFAQAVWNFDSCNLKKILPKMRSKILPNGIDSGAKEEFQEH